MVGQRRWGRDSYARLRATDRSSLAVHAQPLGPGGGAGGEPRTIRERAMGTVAIQTQCCLSKTDDEWDDEDGDGSDVDDLQKLEDEISDLKEEERKAAKRLKKKKLKEKRKTAERINLKVI